MGYYSNDPFVFILSGSGLCACNHYMYSRFSVLNVCISCCRVIMFLTIITCITN